MSNQSITGKGSSASNGSAVAGRSGSGEQSTTGKQSSTGKKFWNWAWKLGAAAIILVIAACSTSIESVVQPGSVNGGDILNVTLNCKIETNATQTSNWMVAVLVPKVWKAAQNTTITFTSEITSGDQPMSVIPAGTPAPNGGGLDWPTLLAQRMGNGGNLLPDYEWVAFYSNASYSVAANATIKPIVSIKIKTSPDNLMFKLAYVVANSSDGLGNGADKYGSYFSGSENCFTVNGTGDLIDFCNPQISSVDPRTSTDNDIVTLSFDGGVAPTNLDNASAIYLCAAGITSTGDSISVCEQTDRTKMRSLGLNKWQIDIWPRKLFNLSATQHLTGLRYYFTDANGNNKVGYGGGADPFTYSFKCQ